MAPIDPEDDDLGASQHTAEIDLEISSATERMQADPSSREAGDALSQALRKGHRWHELQEHNEQLITQTMRMDEQAALHAELADLLATRLESPLEAVKVRKRVEFWNDPKAVTEFYWHNLAEAGDDEQAWEEAEEFFRVNGLWSDLATLLQKRIADFAEPMRLPLYDQIVEAYKSMNPPRFEELNGFLEFERTRSTLDTTKAHLTQLLPRVAKADVEAKKTARAAEARAIREELAKQGTPPAVVAAAALVTVLLIVLAVFLIVTRLH